MNLPKEPGILMSFINMKLRDNYSSLEAMCEDLDLSLSETEEELKKAGLRYDSDLNQLKER